MELGCEIFFWMVVTIPALSLGIPCVLWTIRLLNETWLDPDWRAARRERRLGALIREDCEPDDSPARMRDAEDADV